MPSRKVGRRAHVATKPRDRIDVLGANEPPNIAQSATELARKSQGCGVRAAREWHLLNREKLEARRRNEIRFEADFRAEGDHSYSLVALRERSGNREHGRDVSRASGARDENGCLGICLGAGLGCHERDPFVARVSDAGFATTVADFFE